MAYTLRLTPRFEKNIQRLTKKDHVLRDRVYSKHINRYLKPRPEITVLCPDLTRSREEARRTISPFTYELYNSDTQGRGRRLLVRGHGSAGCYTQGKSIDETLRNTKEAIEVIYRP